MSLANIERLFKNNPETAAEDDPMLKAMTELGDTPEFHRRASEGMMALQHGKLSSLNVD